MLNVAAIVETIETARQFGIGEGVVAAAFSAGGGCMRAFVSDQSSSFNSVVIGTAPDSTVVASLKLPPGSWVVFATVALAAATSGFQVVPITTGLVLDTPTTLQVACVATRKNTVSSQPTTITAIEVESVTRIT